MSTRWYPIYQRGNPQLRVFLPNFWMKLVKPSAVFGNATVPENKVTIFFTDLFLWLITTEYIRFNLSCPVR